MQVLIVDDEEDIRLMLKILMSRITECSILTYSGVEETLQNIDNINPRVAFLDISLKDGKGYDLIPVLKKTMGDDLKIIMISAFDNEKEKQHALDIGADYFIGKPLSKSIITDSLQEVGIHC